MKPKVSASRVDFKSIQPRPVSLDDSKVRIDHAFEGHTYPVKISPEIPGLKLSPWFGKNRQLIDHELSTGGAVLLRGFEIDTVGDFDSFLGTLPEERVRYTVRSSPRKEVLNSIYTSTEYPKDQSINMHNENSYDHNWPMKIIFCCLHQPEEGGETPIADSRKILKALSGPLVKKFESKGVLYVRNFGGGLGLSWPEVFQTDSKADLEAYFVRHQIDFSWKKDDGLTIKYVRPAIRLHPESREQVWFNHAFFFNIHSLDDAVKNELLKYGNADELPYMTYYGDGAEIEKETIDEIKSVYANEMRIFQWRKGDILILDNMLMAHGRKPFQGERKILVSMHSPVLAKQLEAQ